MKTNLIISFVIILLSPFLLTSQTKIKVLIVDGQNNHAVWPKSTIMMKQYLLETGLFDVDIYRSKYVWKADREKQFLELATKKNTVMVDEPLADSDFKPHFSKYDVVISNFGWKASSWPKSTQKSFESFIAQGGGFVSIHAANNSFPEWNAYNEIIGLGGWGNRNESNGPYVYYSNDGLLVRDTTSGTAGAHGPQHCFPITIRNSCHPITAGMPDVWFTTKDECYAKLRGPAKNLTILATGKDMNDNAPTNRHEPILMVLKYKKGRVFHTTLGHDEEAIEGVGFIISFLRGVQWAATGLVTIPIPDDFPNAENANKRIFKLSNKF